MDATDPDGDIQGGQCTFRSLIFVGVPVIVVTPAMPPDPLVVTCTVTVPAGFTGQPLSGTIGIADAAGNVSNQLGFTTTLPERPRRS
jgi:hypothetical protein